MSRETDTPSPGPHGSGGASYPSGTPPYGTPTTSGDGADAGRSATQPEERKTETTLTTRIRINIPGSRPIPPVVMRTPVADAEGTDEPGAGTPAPGPEASAPAEAPAAETPAPGAEDKTSDWFAPRKGGAPGKGGQGSGSTNGAGLPGGSPAPGTSAPAPGTPAPGTGGGARAGVVGAMGVTGGPRPGGTNGAGLPGATGGPVAPGHGGGTGSFDVTEALASGPLGNGAAPTPPGPAAPGEPRRDDLPYFAENYPDDGTGTPNGFAGPAEGQGGPGAPQGPGGPQGSGGPFGGGQGPAGPTGGPVTGDGPLAPNLGGAPARGPRPVPGGGLSDDTAILTPQVQAPEPPDGHGYLAPQDNVSGQTLTSGIPVVPPAGNTPFAPGAHPDGPLPHTPPRQPEPPAQAAAPAAAPRKKKGRSKLALLVGGLVVIGGVAYGAGLLMNHSDVPKGTTVLGVDISGTRDDAVKKLDDAFGGRVDQSLKLSVDGKTVEIKPDQAGLQLDDQATVRNAATSDYNPVSVIGSLFGNHRVVAPVMPVDEEKLRSALQSASGGAGSVTEGGIKFESGKAVAVYGKAGKGIDVDQSVTKVEDAYRAQVETGTAPAVQLATTSRKPTVSDAEVDRMMKKFAEPAMSATVTVQTDAAHSVSFSPQNSLWQFLGVKAQDGKLVEYYDKTALEKLYGGTFDGVTVSRGTGQKTAVTVEDVISALRPALLSTTDRVGVIDTDPN
ncbi:hypothetical protein [Streptomyces sp. NPDC008150]|uniref:hypothetical protein n=1 Tax=Streptomyces sp. NPDC008150 TaxID=3364816 RepID=UPI0036E6C220